MKNLGFLAAILVLGLGGCALGDSDAPRTSAEKTTAACKSDADRAFLKQNRAYLSEQSTTDSPFSSTGFHDIPSAGLGDEFSRDQALDQCLKSSGNAGH